MKSESEESNVERISRYNEIIAFEPDEFVTAFTWAMNAASGEAHIGDPKNFGSIWLMKMAAFCKYNLLIHI